MTKFIWYDNQWMRAVRVFRPSVFPGIIRDSMDAVLHPCDGQLYDSKSQFRRVTAEHGMVELGNDAPMSMPEYKPVGIKDDIVESIKKLEQGYRPEPDEAADSLDGVAVETRILE